MRLDPVDYAYFSNDLDSLDRLEGQLNPAAITKLDSKVHLTWIADNLWEGLIES